MEVTQGEKIFVWGLFLFNIITMVGLPIYYILTKGINDASLAFGVLGVMAVFTGNLAINYNKQVDPGTGLF